jgi:hypothetical protein
LQERGQRDIQDLGDLAQRAQGDELVPVLNARQPLLMAVPQAGDQPGLGQVPLPAQRPNALPDLTGLRFGAQAAG